MLNQKFNLYKREWLDLVFAGRNQAYGAYDLRVHYGENLMKALAIAFAGLTMAAISLTLIFQHKPDVIVSDTGKKPDVVIPDINIIKPVIEQPKLKKVKTHTSPKPPATTNVTTQALHSYKPTNDPVETVEPVAVTQLTQTISSVDHQGDDKGPGVLPGTAATGPGGSGTLPGKGDDGTVHTLNDLDAMPEPVGGEKEWMKFLQNNVRYPDTDAEGRVTLTFVIEKDGRLSDIKVLKGVSYELDQEAIRVLKRAKAWKPGMQQGQPVRVRFTLPIIFSRMQ